MNPFIGEIVLFAGNFAPRGWAKCEGQLLAISSNEALFSIIGTIYGGDGRTTFALPDLRGRVPISPGNGPGLPSYREGQKVGAPTTTLTAANMANLNVLLPASEEDADSDDPSGRAPAVTESFAYAAPVANVHTAAGRTTGGGQQPFNNIQPSLAIYYIIATVGVYPSRS